jgi:ABC-type antimicrobial peptide transport system permease subunit
MKLTILFAGATGATSMTAPLLLAIAVIVANYLPARHATSLNSVQVLKVD